MASHPLDNEFMQYWLKLTMPEKQSLLRVAKNYVQLKQETSPVNIDEYNKDIDEGMKRMDAGKFYTHDQVAEISKAWLKK